MIEEILYQIMSWIIYELIKISLILPIGQLYKNRYKNFGGLDHYSPCTKRIC